MPLKTRDSSEIIKALKKLLHNSKQKLSNYASLKRLTHVIKCNSSSVKYTPQESRFSAKKALSYGPQMLRHNSFIVFVLCSLGIISRWSSDMNLKISFPDVTNFGEKFNCGKTWTMEILSTRLWSAQSSNKFVHCTFKNCLHYFAIL